MSRREKDMLIPIITVQTDNYEHIVGTNSHDVLYVDEATGGIQYFNMQSCETTKRYNKNPSVCFKTEPMEEYDVFGPEIKFVTIEELMEIAIKQMQDDTERTRKLHELMKVYMDKKKECQDMLKDDDMNDSGGTIIF